MRNFTNRPWCKNAALALFAAGQPSRSGVCGLGAHENGGVRRARRHGGGADQMARIIQGIIAKNKLMKEPMVVVNKAGGAGAEGFLDVKESKGDPHKLIITCRICSRPRLRPIRRSTGAI